jgi:adenylosuccinate lyase
MIERYTLPDMGRIWSDENKLSKWLEFEILACEALAELGEIPAEAVARIKKNARFDAKRVLEIEEVTHHDVIAFLTIRRTHRQRSRYVHPTTSSDLLPIPRSPADKEAGELLAQGIAVPRHDHTRALEHKHGDRPQPRRPRRADHVGPKLLVATSWAAASRHCERN